MKEGVFQNLKNAVREARKRVADNFREESQGPNMKWSVYDSPLIGDDPFAYDRNFPFDRSPSTPHIGAYIEHYLQSKKGKAIGIDIGGTGVRLFQDFSPGFFKQTFGIVLSRSHYAEQEISAERHHNVIAADVFSSTGWNKVRHVLEGKGVDCILERMVGGWSSAPQHSINFLYLTLNRWYQLLNRPGIMFVEVHVNTYSSEAEKRFELINEWCRQCRDIPVPGITFDYIVDPSNYFYARLEKGSEAPDRLPTFAI